ncbi:MAG: protein kinase [Myxococcota bacterium]
MAKTPLAKKPDARRTDRRTRISSGPAPLPPPVSTNPLPPRVAPRPSGTSPPKIPPGPPSISGDEDEALARAKTTPRVRKTLKKTQMIMGAPPVPPPTGEHTKVGVPVPPPAAESSSDPIPTDFGLPSHQQTVVGPAPAPDIPTPFKPAPSGVVEQATGPAPASNVPTPVKPATSDAMEQMMDGVGLFHDDFEDEQATALHRGPSKAGDADDEPPSAAPPSAKSPPKPPPRPVSGPAPRATSALRDTMPAAELRKGPTFPGSGSHVSADTQLDLDRGPRPTDEHLDDKRGESTNRRTDRQPTRMRSSPGQSRDSRVGTAMQGMEGLVAPAADAPKIRLIPGKQIPGTRYEIRRWLGEGGMGVVYEVIHTDIERRSALKILRFDLSQQPQMAQVFRDEARAASRLGSPHIVEVYDFGELPDGRLFFAMELLEGVDLVPANEQTSMEPSRLVAILRQVCKGLAKAHDANVVHRDVKPENIIITNTEEGRADSIKIVDFGISAMLAAGEKKAGIAGTPHYMAPEQILGEDFDGRLDIYALGCTAYELMVGTPPFDADEVEELLKKQVKVDPTPPSQARDDVEFPAELEAVVMRCLAKKPEDRFENMAELEAAICEAQIAAGITTAWDDLPVPVIADTERYERILARMPSPNAPQPAKRGWLWPVIAGASTLAAAGLAAYLMFGRQPTAEEQDQVEQLTIEARDAASKAAWVIPPPHVEGNTTALRKVVELEGLEGLAQSLADERAEELRHEFATTLIGHGDHLWEEARSIARQYYVWSLAFENSEYAFDRADVDLISLSDFRKNAVAGDFSQAEVLLGSLAVIQVAEDPEQKEAISAAIQEGVESSDMAPMMLAQFTKRAESAGVKLRRPRRGSGARGNGGRNQDRDGDRDGGRSDGGRSDGGRSDGGVDSSTSNTPPPPPSVAETDQEPIIDQEPVIEDDPVTTAGRRKRRRQVDMGLDDKKAKFNPARSKELTKKADAKRRDGLRGEAKSLYSQAIAANPKNGAAHLGLAQVHFDQASYDKARKSALQAVKHSPRNGRAHKVLGDAYYKAFRYQEAEGAYQKAQELGINVRKRLADVRRKLGK